MPGSTAKIYPASVMEHHTEKNLYFGHTIQFIKCFYENGETTVGLT